MLPFLGSICLWFRNQKKATRATGAVCILLTFLAAFSQEQFAVLTLSFYVLNILFGYMTKTMKNLRFQFGVCVSALTGGAITILAPGNMAVIISGNRANYEINQKNNQILTAVREQCNENEPEKQLFCTILLPDKQYNGYNEHTSTDHGAVGNSRHCTYTKSVTAIVTA